MGRWFWVISIVVTVLIFFLLAAGVVGTVVVLNRVGVLSDSPQQEESIESNVTTMETPPLRLSISVEVATQEGE